jgi:hypothetical protein
MDEFPDLLISGRILDGTCAGTGQAQAFAAQSPIFPERKACTEAGGVG